MPRYAPLKTWVSVTSSNVAAVWYDAEAELLKVRFHVKKGGAIVGTRTWGYSGVPLYVYTDMLDAPSKGQFVWKHLRDRYLSGEIGG